MSKLNYGSKVLNVSTGKTLKINFHNSLMTGEMGPLAENAGSPPRLQVTKQVCSLEDIIPWNFCS